MTLQALVNICGSTLCADLKHMVLMGLFLAVTLLLLNLPRVSIWAVDTWNQRRVDRGNRE